MEAVAANSITMRQLLIYSFIFFGIQLSFGQKSIHALWNSELKKYVKPNGQVDYEAWKEDPDALNGYIQYLEQNPPASYWSKNDSLAYFINAYNAVTVQLILEHYPIKSIRRLITPWRFKRFKLHNQKVSLNHIEHSILRKMGEPRIHFAINCASASCPKLQNQAFESHRIHQQLDEVTKEFINDPGKNVITEDRLSLSRIFQWFARDFGNKKERLQFIQNYVETPINPKAKIDFLNYDWSLNE